VLAATSEPTIATRIEQFLIKFQQFTAGHDLIAQFFLVASKWLA
jgi:hypothetical protein